MGGLFLGKLFDSIYRGFMLLLSVHLFCVQVQRSYNYSQNLATIRNIFEVTITSIYMK